MNSTPNFFPYYGGKFRFAKKLIELFPVHFRYVDVFGGAGNLLLQKQQSKVEIFNDIDSEIINLFSQVRDNFDDFLHKITYTPYSRQWFLDSKSKFENVTEPLERAYMWYEFQRQSFNALGQAWRSPKNGINRVDMDCRAKELTIIMKRLRNVVLENKNFDYILKKYDSADTFFYCDPPYYASTRRSNTSYTNEMSTLDHEQLIRILSSVKGKVMLSGYDNDLYNTLKWNKKQFERQLNASKKEQIQIETIWYNYEIKETTKKSVIYQRTLF